MEIGGNWWKIGGILVEIGGILVLFTGTNKKRYIFIYLMYQHNYRSMVILASQIYIRLLVRLKEFLDFGHRH